MRASVVILLVAFVAIVQSSAALPRVPPTDPKLFKPFPLLQSVHTAFPPQYVGNTFRFSQHQNQLRHHQKQKQQQQQQQEQQRPARTLANDVEAEHFSIVELPTCMLQELYVAHSRIVRANQCTFTLDGQLQSIPTEVLKKLSIELTMHLPPLSFPVANALDLCHLLMTLHHTVASLKASHEKTVSDAKTSCLPRDIVHLVEGALNHIGSINKFRFRSRHVARPDPQKQALLSQNDQLKKKVEELTSRLRHMGYSQDGRPLRSSSSSLLESGSFATDLQNRLNSIWTEKVPLIPRENTPAYSTDPYAPLVMLELGRTQRRMKKSHPTLPPLPPTPSPEEEETAMLGAYFDLANVMVERSFVFLSSLAMAYDDCTKSPNSEITMTYFVPPFLGEMKTKDYHSACSAAAGVKEYYLDHETTSSNPLTSKKLFSSALFPGIKPLRDVLLHHESTEVFERLLSLPSRTLELYTRTGVLNACSLAIKHGRPNSVPVSDLSPLNLQLDVDTTIPFAEQLPHFSISASSGFDACRLSSAIREAFEELGFATASNTTSVKEMTRIIDNLERLTNAREGASTGTAVHMLNEIARYISVPFYSIDSLFSHVPKAAEKCNVIYKLGNLHPTKEKTDLDLHSLKIRSLDSFTLCVLTEAIAMS